MATVCSESGTNQSPNFYKGMRDAAGITVDFLDDEVFELRMQ